MPKLARARRDRAHAALRAPHLVAPSARFGAALALRPEPESSWVCRRGLVAVVGARAPSPVARRLTLPLSPQNKNATVTDEAVVEEEANEALWQADWDDEDTSADFQTKLKAELQQAAAQAQAAK